MTNEEFSNATQAKISAKLGAAHVALAQAEAIIEALKARIEELERAAAADNQKEDEQDVE